MQIHLDYTLGCTTPSDVANQQPPYPSTQTRPAPHQPLSRSPQTSPSLLFYRC
ncbi:hypothetical protein BX600DRAFT_476563 [Xylariales sp. PMI_506]|nr:hypothetical protein BX600DRAFT_476563 [Xylariales sp. PMI_506]